MTTILYLGVFCARRFSVTRIAFAANVWQPFCRLKIHHSVNGHTHPFVFVKLTHSSVQRVDTAGNDFQPRYGTDIAVIT